MINAPIRVLGDLLHDVTTPQQRPQPAHRIGHHALGRELPGSDADVLEHAQVDQHRAHQRGGGVGTLIAVDRHRQRDRRIGRLGGRRQCAGRELRQQAELEPREPVGRAEREPGAVPTTGVIEK